MITYRESAELVGARITVAFRGIKFIGTIRDIREAYGKIQVEFVPDAGFGRAWFDRDNVAIIASPTGGAP